MMDPHDDESPDNEILVAINAYRNLARAQLHLDDKTSNAVQTAKLPHERVIFETPAKTPYGLIQKAKFAIEMYELVGDGCFIDLFCREAASAFAG